MRTGTRPISLLLLLALLAWGGCIFSPDESGPDTPPPVDNPLPWPDTADQLMANFRTVYSGMDLVKYRDDVLSPDFLFVLQAETVEQFQLPDNIYEYEDEIAIADNMFSGRPNSDGIVVSEIEIQTLQPQGTWLPVPQNDPYFGGFPGALVRNYEILFYFNAPTNFRYEVQGNQMFYVTADTLMRDGVPTPYFRLLGQLDQTSIIQGKALTAGI